jgi:hypothetical protein
MSMPEAPTKGRKLIFTAPAVGTIAAFELQGFGTSRWQLVWKITPISSSHERGFNGHNWPIVLQKDFEHPRTQH